LAAAGRATDWSDALLFPTSVAAIGGQRVAWIVEGSSRRLAEMLSDPDRRALVAGKIDRRDNAAG
jgi:hypothetical protein